MSDLLPAGQPNGRRSPPCPPVSVKLFVIAKKADWYSPKTLTKYQTGLHDLMVYAQANGFPDDLFEFKERHIQQWLGELRDRHSLHPPWKKISPATQWTYWMAVKMFYKWAQESGYIKGSPCARIRGPKQAERVIVPLKEEHIEAMMALCPPNTWWGARNKAIISLLLTTGIRREELVGLDVGDIDFDLGQIKVVGKGDQHYCCKERTVPILPQAVSPLLNWIRQRDIIQQEAALDTARFFLMQTNSNLKGSGGSSRWSPLTANAVVRMFGRLRRAAGIEGVRVSAHTHRHTYSITLQRQRLPRRSLQDLLGHKDPRSTDVYTRFVDHEEVMQELREANPFGKWKGL